MGNAPLPDEKKRTAWEAVKEAGSISAAARKLGIRKSTFENHFWQALVDLDLPDPRSIERSSQSVRDAAASGNLGFRPVLPGFTIKSTSAKTDNGEWVKQVREPGDEFEVPPGHRVKGVSALVDSDGKELAKWIKTTEFHSAIDMVEVLKLAFSDFERFAEPMPVPDLSFAGRLILHPLPDLHAGLMSWGRENSEDWDLKIAESVVTETFGKLVSRSNPAEVAVLLGGGDQMHANTNENVTARSRHSLQVDGRYDKILETTCRLFVHMADMLLSKHGRVVIRVLKGNHDEEASVAIAYFLLAWYRNEPRVTVDTDPSLFWWFLFGKTFLGATHGHTVKREKMPSIMAHRQAQSWGASVARYVHTFHLHNSQRISTELEGVIVETHQSPAAQDSYNFGSGYLSGRSLSAIIYDKEHGEVGRAREPIFSA